MYFCTLNKNGKYNGKRNERIRSARKMLLVAIGSQRPKAASSF